MSYRIQAVDRIPSELADEVIYVSEEYEIAALKCACGCGHSVTLLLGDGHQVVDRDGAADVSPSIGVWDAPCRSHFLIKNGKVVWANQMSEQVIQVAMEAQLQRHLEMSRKPWYRRFWKAVQKLFR